MKALVTGITGFAGGHLAEHLLDCGEVVLGVARQAAWPPQSPARLAGLPLTRWDIAEPSPAACRAEVERFAPDCVYHLAAMSVPADCGDAEPTADAWRVNVEGTRHVVELCLGLARPPRLVLVSSSQVYGSASAESPPVAEAAAPRPTRGYGVTKFAAECQALAAGEQGLPVIVARAFQHAGPRQSARLMLAEWAAQFALESGPIRVQRLRAGLDLSDVRDVVRAYRLLATHGAAGMVYNVGSGRTIASGEVFAELRRLADPARPFEQRYDDARQDPVADVARLRAATGWTPVIDWRQTVADTWNDWRQRAAAMNATRREI